MRAGPAIGLVIAVLLWGLVAGCHHSDPAPPTFPGPPPWQQDQVPRNPEVWQEWGEYISEDLCEICHPDTVADFEGMPHSRLIEGIEGTGCEACHGPGEAHEADEDGLFVDDYLLLDKEEVAKRCARCHFDDLRLLDKHHKHGIAATRHCISCHKIHPEGTHDDEEDPEKRARIRQEIRECRTCHQDALKVHLRSNHARLVAGPEAVGCRACHGDGEEHIRTGGLAAIDRPDEAQSEKLCVDCHSQRLPHARWHASAHQKAGLGCLECHDLLQPTGTVINAKSEMELCGRCHEAVASKFRQQFHHPVEDGKECTTCHDPHRDRTSVLMSRNMERRCADCHRGQTGPHVYEHQAGRVDGCQACHDPHASGHPRLLTSWPVRNLCLSCHPNTPLNHDQSAFSPFRECVTCHTEVHGSDIDRNFFR